MAVLPISTLSNEIVSSAGTTMTIEPLKPSDLTYEQLVWNLGAENGNTIIKGHQIYGLDAFFSATQPDSSEPEALLNLQTVSKSLKPYMPFSKWIKVTSEIKSILGLPSEITVDGKYAIQLAFFFPKASGRSGSPQKLIITYKIEGEPLPESLIQPLTPYEDELAALNARFNMISDVLINPEAPRDDVKFFADYGIISFQNKYAFYCHEGIDGPRDLSESRKYFKLAADQGDMKAQYNFGLMCYEGWGGSRDRFIAKEYFKMAADQGYMLAQFFYAKLSRDAESREYFKMAADQGLADAQNEFAFISLRMYGHEGPTDPIIAKEYFKKSADQNNKKGQYWYASMCYKGEGGPQDLPTAREYFRKVAIYRMVEANEDEPWIDFSQFSYAEMCHKGEGGPQDLPTAREYYKLQAERNNDHAQFKYAIMCRDGEGGPIDLPEARKYFEKAAAKAMPAAREALAAMNS